MSFQSVSRTAANKAYELKHNLEAVMLKITSLAIIGALAFAPAVYAKGHSNGNNAAATDMADAIKANAKGIAAELGGSPNATLTQKPSDRGWGKAGSAVLSTSQVSRGQGPKK
ncbi:MAG: hypothetical protein KJN60_12745 [Boseongicola sp.]|nr:hypothetical protein [Boseongicola sp.]